MSILSSTKTGIYDVIEKWLNENGIKKYEIKENSDKTEDNEPKYTINIENASVNLIGYNEKEELPSYIKFGKIIGGDFLCSYGKFTTMKRFPKKVEGRFDMRYTKIKNFDGVPELTEISDYAFSGCVYLQEVKIPDSVKKIGKYAFYNCSNLTKIEIPKSIEEIAENAFEGCPSLKVIQKY
jgi:hypothetical protein